MVSYEPWPREIHSLTYKIALSNNLHNLPIRQIFSAHSSSILNLVELYDVRWSNIYLRFIFYWVCYNIKFFEIIKFWRMRCDVMRYVIFSRSFDIYWMVSFPTWRTDHLAVKGSNTIIFIYLILYCFCLYQESYIGRYIIFYCKEVGATFSYIIRSSVHIKVASVHVSDRPSPIK